MTWLVKRLREPSTWRGLVWLATVAGVTLSPDQTEAIIAAGMALAGLLGVLLPETPPYVLPPIVLQSVRAADADTDQLRVDVQPRPEAQTTGFNG